MLEPTPPRAEPAANEPFYREQIAEMTRQLEAVRDLPELPAFRSTGRLPAAFFEHFNAALACYDRLIEFVLAADGPDEAIQCRKGCSNCCIDLVRGITTPEIINIYHHVRTWPDVKQLFEYHRDSAELFMNILSVMTKPGEEPPGGRDPRIAEAHVRFNSMNRRCGFLDAETGCCRIYPVRPVACRYFFSLDPPETCSPLHVLYLERRTRTVHLPEEIHALLREIDHRFGFRPLNFLAGAFCQFAAEVMRTRPIQIGQ
ncbi:MAG: YkgJ family cysteine cluster protein [Planctomycetes bacterium]|nr:YkgJ family cysteine cluster protein [Planctomycetota bacterium]